MVRQAVGSSAGVRVVSKGVMVMEVMDSALKQCGPRIRKIRKRQGKSLPYMAGVAGKTVQLLSMFELGKCGISLMAFTKLMGDLNLKLSIYGTGKIKLRELNEPTSNGSKKK